MTSKHRGLRAGRPMANHRARKARFLVITNGEVTEPEYFDGLERELKSTVITVRHFREDPAKLAEEARDLKSKEEGRRRAGSVCDSDAFRRVFVVTDVDQFTSDQFQKAARICRGSGIELIISNPCFEVWLIDHLSCCPESFTTSSDVERKAHDLKIVKGSRDKHVDYPVIQGKWPDACNNARRHNAPSRRQTRESLGSTSFGPWTDMPNLIGCVASEKSN